MNETTSATTPLAGRRALVIGAGSAAGRAAALALAEAGADIACAATSIEGEEVMATRRTRRAVEALGRRAAEYAFDLALGQNVRVSTRQVAKELGGLEILVTVVLPDLRRPAAKTGDAEWTRTLNLGLSGVFYAIRSALGEMDRGGRIVCIVSDLAMRGAAERAAVGAAQHGVIGLVRAVAAEQAGRGVTVNAIALPIADGENETAIAALRPLVVLLASDAAAGINGQLFALGGGD